MASMRSAHHFLTVVFLVGVLLLVRSPAKSVVSASPSSLEDGGSLRAHRELKSERHSQHHHQQGLASIDEGAAVDGLARRMHSPSLQNRRILERYHHRRRLGDGSGALIFGHGQSSGGGGGGGFFGYGEGTTGGSGGEVVFVTNFDDSGPDTLRFWCGVPGKKIIKFKEDCTISLNSRVECTNDKTVDGSGYQVRITGWGLSANEVNNVVFKNLCIKNTRLDGITARLSSKIVVEGCSFSGIKDGAVDIIEQSTDVSILRNHFMGVQKTILVGNSDRDSADRNVRATVAFNYFDDCGSRQPRVRFATVHVCANLYSSWGNYAIGANKGARLLVENCFFHSGENEYINNLHEGENDGTIIEYRNNDYNGAELLLQALGSVDIPFSCPDIDESSVMNRAGVPYSC